jgi:hypothetical protein
VNEIKIQTYIHIYIIYIYIHPPFPVQNPLFHVDDDNDDDHDDHDDHDDNDDNDDDVDTDNDNDDHDDDDVYLKVFHTIYSPYISIQTRPAKL